MLRVEAVAIITITVIQALTVYSNLISWLSTRQHWRDRCCNFWTAEYIQSEFTTTFGYPVEDWHKNLRGYMGFDKDPFVNMVKILNCGVMGRVAMSIYLGKYQVRTPGRLPIFTPIQVKIRSYFLVHYYILIGVQLSVLICLKYQSVH